MLRGNSIRRRVSARFDKDSIMAGIISNILLWFSIIYVIHNGKEVIEFLFGWLVWNWPRL